MERRGVPVNPRVLTLNPYPASYCPSCDVYTFGDFESRSSKDVGDKITILQANTNLSNTGSPFGHSRTTK